MRPATNLAALAMLCCALLAGLATTHAQTAPLAGPTKVYLPVLASPPGLQTAEQRATAARVLALINEQRAAAGCGPLVNDDRLVAAAQKHSRDMADNNFFDHRGSAGSLVGERVVAAGYSFWKVGENIAAGQNTPEAVVNAWMNSPGHRENILDCAYRHTGIGFVYDANDAPLSGVSWPYYRYWTQVFGNPR
jgi:uncharacterized protein YkwD